MRIVTTIAEIQRTSRRWQGQGKRSGFVPTMGYLHDGHLSLVRQARSRVGIEGVVVVSIYVNPTQFGPQEDLSKYPRDLPCDLALCRAAGVDVVFVPSDAEMYPQWGEAAAEPARGGFSTYVVEEQLAQTMEGAARPAHFRGVTTIVAKLFNLVLPNIALFGAKDFQQAAVIRRMVRDLNFPVKIVVAPTQREADGLALSSRNKYLSPDERRQAVVLSQACKQARMEVRKSTAPVSARRLKVRLTRFIQSQPAARIDYLEFFDPATLRPVIKVTRGAQLALAVFVGKTRLIDNAAL